MKKLLALPVLLILPFLFAACTTADPAAADAPSGVPLGIALVAGLASFLSPCVLSLVPAYIGYLGGRAAGGESAASNRWITFLHGLAFVLGFSIVFVLFNVVASVLGGLLADIRFVLEKIGGFVVIVFGLHMIGLFRIPFLEYDIRVHKQVNARWGYLSSFLMGIFFSAGWAPCTGPVLAAIATLSLRGGSVLQGALLGLVYSAGMAIPFLLAALGIGWVTVLLRRYSKVMRITEIVMGVLLVLIGVLLLTGYFNWLASIFPTSSFGG